MRGGEHGQHLGIGEQLLGHVTAFFGQLHRALDILERGARYQLEMDVAGVARFQPESLDGSEHLLHGHVSVGHNARGEKQAIHLRVAVQ